jgi:hypothetical protein
MLREDGGLVTAIEQPRRRLLLPAAIAVVLAIAAGGFW